MSGPLYRGSSGGGYGVGFDTDGWNSSLDKSSLAKDHQNGHGHSCNLQNSMISVSRSRVRAALFILKLSLVVIVLLALSGSLYWTLSISSTPRVTTYYGYRRLQEKLVADLSEIEELSLGVVKSKELEFCPQEYENYVPCYYNITEDAADTDSSDAPLFVKYQRRCFRDPNERKTCLVLAPQNYRIPLRWPTGRDFIWKENVKITGHEFSSGSLTKRMMVEEEQISFHSESLMVDGVEDYSHQIAEMIGLRDASGFNDAGIRNVLDIGCGYGSFGAHLFSKHILTTCIANYETSGSQVQLTLERGLPAIIGSFGIKQLPFPYLSFDVLHCAHCGIDWESEDGIFLIEVDRLMKPGGYFVWTSQTNSPRLLRIKENKRKLELIRGFAENLCWEMLSQQDETFVWKKASNNCYKSRKSGPEVCSKSQDVEAPYYRPLLSCIAGTRSNRWVSIENRPHWPSRAKPNSSELSIYGLHMEDFSSDAINWNLKIGNYWSLLSPLIFSDHPKRPGTDDPSPPPNMVRNVLDMNARFGGFNAALLEAGKSLWVMNVVPTTGPDHLPLILDRGFIGVQHDWCDAFPTYPRTYDMVHADRLLSLEASDARGRCSMLDLFFEIDRILRPEGWVIFRDTRHLMEAARYITTQLKWDARLIELDIQSDERLLICQKPFFKKQQIQ